MDHLPAKQKVSAIFLPVSFKHHNMKPLLYIGVTLMIGAGIYGFVDFKNKKKSKEFQSLYRQEQPKNVQEPVIAEPAPAAISAAIVDTTAATKPVVKEKIEKFSPRQFSRAALVKEEAWEEDSLPEPEKKWDSSQVKGQPQ
jgi:hypothetical protein